MSVSALATAMLACSSDRDAADDDKPEQDAATQEAPSCEDTEVGELFDQRIAPLLADDRPKSCNQCHLAGIDLGSFVRDDACETMACLVEDELVDLEHPEKSLLLSWIGRAEPDSDLITQQVIDEEYQGLLQWIEHSAACGGEQCAQVECGERDEELSCSNQSNPSEEQVDELRKQEPDCTDLGLERLFRETVYASRGRCFPCHYDIAVGEVRGEPPPWIITELPCDQASLATLREIERRGLMDTEDPEQSLLLLKPLGEDEGGVEHGGSEKFHGEDDPGYQSFMLFLERYSECQ